MQLPPAADDMGALGSGVTAGAPIDAAGTEVRGENPVGPGDGQRPEAPGARAPEATSVPEERVGAVVPGPGATPVPARVRLEGDAGGSQCAPFPASECANEAAVAECESTGGRNPAAYRLDAPNAGRLQLNRVVWREFFERNYGWSWESIVFDDQRNREAAFVVWQRAGGSWSPWSCRP